MVIHIGAPDYACCSPVEIFEVKACGHSFGWPSPNAKGGCREVRLGDGMPCTETNPSLDAHALREARYGVCHNCEISEAYHKGCMTVEASDTLTEEVSEPPVFALVTVWYS